MNEFVGLPSARPLAVDGRSPPSAAQSPPSAGRWWIRGCALTLVGRQQLRLHVSGPGWYWVDVEDDDWALHQQVPFDLDAELAGTIRMAYVGGVASVWVQLASEPSVQVEASPDLELSPKSLWGELLKHAPLVPIRAVTAQRLSEAAGAAFRSSLRDGLTVTYDMFRGQPDMALGQLAPGATPAHPFDDGDAWLANERLILHGHATHVFGPIDPLPVRIDARIELGPGLTYRTLCVADMPGNFRVIAAGEPERIAEDALLASGSLLQGGAETAELRVSRCPYYLVVSSATDNPTIASLWVRG